MLKTQLLGSPPPKFIIIQDCVEAKGVDFLDFLIKNHQKQHSNIKIHLFVFENNFTSIRMKHKDVICHDFTSDTLNWLCTNKSEKFALDTSSITEECIVIVDSLSHILINHELSDIYKIFNNLTKNQSNVIQVITLLHSDLLIFKDSVIKCFRNLVTIYLELEPKSILTNSNRVAYIHNKSTRKIIKDIEEYHFESGDLVTETIKKPDICKIEDALQGRDGVIPEDLSTFKIGLSAEDKESRSNLVLPYLPKDEGSIHYTFDDVDDWDEEDPDDDLDI